MLPPQPTNRHSSKETLLSTPTPTNLYLAKALCAIIHAAHRTPHIHLLLYTRHAVYH